ncbi:uncharacterized protein [Dermacentor albipictus]|uniref:uncharacterized protein isoform X3 n=1 Tax=Dermacentor albipictus TaxID=60249 RepID=UPI0038FCB943
MCAFPRYGHHRSVVSSSVGTFYDRIRHTRREEENGQWLIAFSCAWMNFFHRGLIRGTAVVYVQLIQTFGITREEAALPLSLVSVIGGCSSLSVGLLTHYLNDRVLVVLATLTSATGLVLCYTATSMVQINFYYSISQGLGTGLVFTLTAVILNNVFKKNRATASGINLSGPTLVALVFPLLFQYCARTYGLRGAFLISSGFTLNALPAAFLLSGSVREPPPEEPEIVNNPRYDCEVNITGSTFTLADISGSTSDVASKARNAARHGGNSVEKEKLLDAKDSGNNNEQLRKHEGPERRRSDEVKLACNLSGAACMEPLGTQRPHGVDPSRRAQERTFADRSCSLPLVKGTLPKVRISKFANAVSMFKVLLCSPYFLLVCLSQVSHVFNHGTFITIIIDYAKDNGIPPEEGIYILLANSAEHNLDIWNVGHQYKGRPRRPAGAGLDLGQEADRASQSDAAQLPAHGNPDALGTAVHHVRLGDGHRCGHGPGRWQHHHPVLGAVLRVPRHTAHAARVRTEQLRRRKRQLL